MKTKWKLVFEWVHSMDDEKPKEMVIEVWYEQTFGATVLVAREFKRNTGVFSVCLTNEYKREAAIHSTFSEAIIWGHQRGKEIFNQYLANGTVVENLRLGD